MISALSIEHHENTVKMLTSVMAVFALFWLPGQVMTFVLEFENENELILNYGLDISYIFAFANCVMNPLIFAYFSQCRSKFPRRPTVSSINGTIACELGFSTFRRESEVGDSIQPRRASLPGILRRVPLAKTLKRPSLPVLHQHKDITQAQNEDLLQQRGTDRDTIFSKRKNSILPQKNMLPALAEIPKSDVISLDQTTDYQQKIQNSGLQIDMQKRKSLSGAVSATTQNDALAHNIQDSDCTQKHSSIPGSHKRLSFSIQRKDASHTTQNNNNFILNTQADLTVRKQSDASDERRKQSQRQKRSSLSILKTRESLSVTQRDLILENEAEKNDVDAGVMKNFLEIMKTMKEDVLKKYLDATPETVLN